MLNINTMHCQRFVILYTRARLVCTCSLPICSLDIKTLVLVSISNFIEYCMYNTILERDTDIIYVPIDK